MPTIRKTPEGIVFKVLIQPRSSRNMVAGLHEDALKIKLTAPPVDNAANRMCLKFLAKALGVSKSSLEIVAGRTSRNKQVLIRTAGSDLSKTDYERLKKRIEDLASG
jgi:hypothetical protein